MRRFDQLGTLWSGSTPSTSTRSFWDGDIVWVTPTDLSRLSTRHLHDSAKRITEKGLQGCSTRLLPPGSIVLSSRAPIGYVAIPTVPFCTNQGCKSIELKDTYHSDFTYYAVSFNVDRLKRMGEGTIFPEISKSALAGVEVAFPDSKDEQATIAEILLTVDLAIEQTEALINKQQRIKAGLMQDLLARGIDEHGNLRSEHTHKFKDWPLGRIPIEWNWHTLDRFLLRKQYGISTSLSDEPSGVPVLRMNNLVSGEVDYSDLKYSNEAATLKLLLNDGDVLFNRTNSIDYVGRTGIFRHPGFDVSFASYLVRLIPDTTMLLPAYLNLWLNDATNQIRVKRFATIGVQQANVNPTNLGTLEFACPSDIKEQQRIVSAVSTTAHALSDTRLQRNKLQSLKTGLMQDLLTGKRRVISLLSAPLEATA